MLFGAVTPPTGVVARVLIDNPLPQLDHLFDYGVPEALLRDIRVGQRVKVPFRSGGRIIDAYVIELIDRANSEVEFSGTLSDIESLVSTASVLTPDVYDLARRVADRGAGSAIDVVRLAVPPRAVRVEKKWLAEAAARDSQPNDEPVDSVDESATDAFAPHSVEISGYIAAVDRRASCRERVSRLV